MDYRTTNKEQVEELKQWWRQYGRWLLLAIMVGLLIGYAWRYWQGRTLDNAARVAETYQQAMQAEQKHDWKAVTAFRQTLVKQSPRHVYTAMLQMQWAQHQFDQKQYAKAISALQWVQTHQSGTVLHDVVQLQLARVAIAQAQYKQALALTNKVGHGLQPMADQIQGLIYQSLGDTAKARVKLLQAQAAYQAIGLNQPQVAMQLASMPKVAGKQAKATAPEGTTAPPSAANPGRVTAPQRSTGLSNLTSPPSKAPASPTRPVAAGPNNKRAAPAAKAAPQGTPRAGVKKPTPPSRAA